MMDDLIVII